MFISTELIIKHNDYDMLASTVQTHSRICSAGQHNDRDMLISTVQAHSMKLSVV